MPEARRLSGAFGPLLQPGIDEGQRFLEATQPALAAVERALHRVRESKDEIAGPRHIVGPRSSFASILMPVIDEFCRLYPDIQPDVPLDDSLGN